MRISRIIVALALSTCGRYGDPRGEEVAPTVPSPVMAATQITTGLSETRRSALAPAADGDGYVAAFVEYAELDRQPSFGLARVNAVGDVLWRARRVSFVPVISTAMSMGTISPADGETALSNLRVIGEPGYHYSSPQLRSGDGVLLLAYQALIDGAEQLYFTTVE